MLRTSFVLALLVLLPCVASAAPQLPAFPGLPADCVAAAPDARLCGGDKPCAWTTQVLATGVPTGPIAVAEGLSGALAATANEVWMAPRSAWTPIPLPEREARPLASGRSFLAARSGSETPTLRRWTAEGWGPAVAAPSSEAWRYHSGSCVMATLAQEQRDGDVLKSKLSVSFRTEEWSKPWIAQAPGPARWRVFPGRDGGLHVFAIIAGPKGQTVWYGRPGQSARVVAGPIDLDGKGMQPSGRGVHLVETQAEAVAILETQRGIQRLELSAGKPTPLVRHERKRSVNEGTGRVVQVDVQPIFVGLLSTDHDARLVYRTRTQTKEFEQDKDPRRGPPRDREVSRTSTERVFVHNPLGGQPHEVKVEGYVARAARTPGGGIWLVGERKNGDSADLLVHVLTDGPLGPTAPISAFDYGAASTDGVKLEFDSEAELMAAGFQRWGVGTSTFSKGRMKVVSQGYEEWFSAASSGLLRGKIGKGYVLKARLRVIEQYKKGMDPARVAHLPNVGVRLGGPFGSASFQVASSRVILTYEGQSTAVSVDGSQMNSFQLAVFSSGKAILYRGGIEIARLVRPLGAPRTDAVHIAVGALGGSVGVTAEFDELEVSNIPK